MEIKEMSLEQLKSIAYDNLVQIEQCQNNLKLLNAEIVERSKKEVNKTKS